MDQNRLPILLQNRAIAMSSNRSGVNQRTEQRERSSIEAMRFGDMWRQGQGGEKPQYPGIP